MRPPVSLTIPQPCSESWAAMTPATAGRHCAACATTVVDFTRKTDAEILAFLAGAARGRTCGRFAAGQLEQPLQRAVPAVPSGRWRAWLAAAVAVWGLREGNSTAASAQAAPAEWRARYWGGPAPAGPVTDSVPPVEAASSTQSAQPSAAVQQILHGVPIIRNYPERPPLLPKPPRVLRGIVSDATNGEGLPGVTVLLKGTQIGTSTGADGHFELLLPELKAGAEIVLISSIGYLPQERPVTEHENEWLVSAKMNTQVLGELVYVRPRPWRSFYSWSKYWLGRPFRG